MDTIISHDGQPAPADAPSTTPAPSPFDSFAAFIAAGHDADLLNWPEPEVEEYGAFAARFLTQAEQHANGGTA